MPFSIQVTGMEDVIRKLDKIGEKAQEVAAQGLYEGAGVMADSISSAINGTVTEPFKYAKGGRQRKPSPEEKALLAQAKHGVAKFRKSGIDIQTSVGLQNSGYGSLNGKTKPIPMIANAINSGTSFMKKQPFFRKAMSKQGQAAAAVESGIESRLDELSLD